ncbi:hypothetical protein RhiirA5_427103 [Rhizophagus irregularis]|uniref:Uncharacterized protein n=1 Tax=Rhizophagus irregularis TaxID=588596 RepID=A0A2I1FCT0_9GLOM|nr:hypothetical protein RhiirA5_427103 [Rhizophagus irregularis]PKC64845.1 hypothetical protein RhiirA1_461860 [Rhizophagus irregularis]PKY32189.1 hypothetical protein RhiirB3_450199 [Rhizophagus irregularis]
MPRILSFLPPTANLKNDIISPLVYDHPSCDDPVNNDPSPLPLTIWASNHEADPSSNDILDLCTPSLQCTNHSRRIWHIPRFLCKRVSFIISPASFIRTQKSKKISFTHLVLFSFTIRTLVSPLSRPFRLKDLFKKFSPDSSIITPHISAIFDTADNNISAPSLVPFLNIRPVDFLPSASASAFLYDDAQRSSYTFTLRTVLDIWI